MVLSSADFIIFVQSAHGHIFFFFFLFFVVLGQEETKAAVSVKANNWTIEGPSSWTIPTIASFLFKSPFID